jgi:outer membrane protein assembly factor BamB
MEYGWPMAHYDNKNTGHTGSQVPVSAAVDWTYDGNGTITTAPIVEYDTVYFMLLENKSTHLVALDAKSGTEKWRYEIPSQGICETTPCAYESSIYFPAVFRVYDSRKGQYYYEYYLLCVDAQTGERRWYVPLSSFPQIGSSPVALDGMVLLGEGYQGSGHVESFDAETGARIWKADVEGDVIHTVSAEGDTVYASTYYGIAYALDASTGAITDEWQLFEAAAMGPITLAGGKMLANGISLELKAQGYGAGQIVALDAQTGGRAWVFGIDDDTSISHCSTSSTLAFVSTYTSEGNATVTCLALSDGSVRWSQDVPQGAVLGGSISVGGGAIVLCDDTNGTARCYRLTDGTLLWEYELGDAAPYTPALAGNKVYLASEGRIVCMG